MNNTAVIARLTNVRPHPNADRIQLATVLGHQVVVGLDNVEGELGVFFGPDLQLSHEMCDANDLVGYTDENGKRKGGFFAANRRVRSQRFRGEKSDGYWTGLESLAFTGVSDFKEGDEFTDLKGIPICNKYITPATQAAMKRGDRRRVNSHFAKHVETSQLAREYNSIPLGSVLNFTEKLHGTSGRFGYVLDERKGFRGWLDRKLGRKTYKHLIGTRNCILEDPDKDGFHGREQFRFDAVAPLTGNLHPGEIMYFELVGYANGMPIMPPHDGMVYSYGCTPDACDLYVYRITRVADDGDAVELSWAQVKKRCRELGVKHVPDIDSGFRGIASRDLLTIAEVLSNGKSAIDGSHIREGVVLRVDSYDGDTYFLKHKSFEFKVLEGIVKLNDDVVDIEEAS